MIVSQRAGLLSSPVLGAVPVSVPLDLALIVRLVEALPSSKLIVTVFAPVASFYRAEACSVTTVLPATAV